VNRTGVLLADDHLVVIQGFSRLLQQHEFDIVGLARDGRELIEIARRVRPDVVVTDITMPHLNGIDAVRILRKEFSSVKVLFLSMHAEHLLVQEAFQAGASGYLLKTCAAEEFVKAVHCVAKGMIYITPQLREDMIPAILTARPGRTFGQRRLTLRRREVLQLLAEGKTMKQVATILGISTRTAEAHKYDIMRKLGVQTTAGLIRYALDLKLV
jgi:DNA-binding NarL/FixJ family response regulator